jgi:heat shock protein HslJ
MDPTGDGVSADSGCNHYSGAYAAAGVALRLRLTRFTDKMCSASVMTREHAYLQALSRVDAYSSSEPYDSGTAELMLASGDGHTLLGFDFSGRFHPAPTTTVAPTATVVSTPLQPGVALRRLALTRFSQDGQDYPRVANVPVTLGLDEQGAVGGSFACHGLGGFYVASGATLRLYVVDETALACTTPAGSLWEAEYLNVLAFVESYRLEDGQLVLSSGGGRLQLTFRELPCQNTGSAQARRALTMPLSGTPAPATPWPCPTA